MIDNVIRAVAPNIVAVEIAGLPMRSAPSLIQLARAPSPGRPAGLPMR
jgi:hypothetical protein